MVEMICGSRHGAQMRIDPALEPFVWRDAARLGGALCFRDTRVPVEALFANLESGMPLNEFLSEFEGVTREQAVAVLEHARRSLAAPDPLAA